MAKKAGAVKVEDKDADSAKYYAKVRAGPSRLLRGARYKEDCVSGQVLREGGWLAGLTAPAVGGR